MIFLENCVFLDLLDCPDIVLVGFVAKNQYYGLIFCDLLENVGISLCLSVSLFLSLRVSASLRVSVSLLRYLYLCVSVLICFSVSLVSFVSLSL